MAGYTKLSSSIVNSSIWDEPDATRIVWVTMLALADKDGIVHASIGGLAHAARVSKEATIIAIDALSAPDPESRHSAEEGRRIKRIEGGWHLVNHHIYRQIGLIEAKREAWAEDKKAQRKSKAADKCPGHVSDSPGHTGLSMGCSVSEGESEGKAEHIVALVKSAFKVNHLSAETLHNCVALVKMGVTAERMGAVLDWRRRAKHGFAPNRPDTLTDPDKFLGWEESMRKDRKQEKPF